MEGFNSFADNERSSMKYRHDIAFTLTCSLILIMIVIKNNLTAGADNIYCNSSGGQIE